MQRLLLSAVAALCLGTAAGCVVPAYSGDPVRRTQELIFSSENMRQLLEEWERMWFLDQPSHMTPYRVHGGII